MSKVSEAQLKATNSMEMDAKAVQALVDAGIIPPGTPFAQIDIFARVCKEKGLSPFAGEIHLTKYFDKKTGAYKFARITGIEGYRKIAARTGELAGCDDPKFDLRGDGSYKTTADMILDGKKHPTTATVTVYRIKGGQRSPFTATCSFNEFAARNKDGRLMMKWASMPYHMIAKCAEALALRKGFDDETSGLHVVEEMAAFEDANTGAIETPEAIEARMVEYEKKIEDIKAVIAKIDNTADLLREFEKRDEFKNDATVISLFTDRKNEILDEKQ